MCGTWTCLNAIERCVILLGDYHHHSWCGHGQIKMGFGGIKERGPTNWRDMLTECEYAASWVYLATDSQLVAGLL